MINSRVSQYALRRAFCEVRVAHRARMYCTYAHTLAVLVSGVPLNFVLFFGPTRFIH